MYLRVLLPSLKFEEPNVAGFLTRIHLLSQNCHPDLLIVLLDLPHLNHFAAHHSGTKDHVDVL
ncbi:hypothetical protein D3C85_1944660 [compost metagenome]